MLQQQIEVDNVKRKDISPVGIRDTSGNNITNINDMYELIEEILSYKSKTISQSIH